MPGPAHEILAVILSEKPELLGELTARLLGRRVASVPRVVDPVVRLAQPQEVRPDLLMQLEAGWIAVEIQIEADAEKRRRWPLLVAALSDRLGSSGDLVLITPSRAVARWARRVAFGEGPLGTTISVQPAVLLLTADRVSRLLDESTPELALFAAWSIQKQHGTRARRVLERALEVTARLPEPLRGSQERAIFGMLSERMAAWIREVAMDPDKIPEGPAAKMLRNWVAQAEEQGQAKGRVEGEAKGRVEGEAKGRADALLAIFEARGLPLSEAERNRITACTDHTRLQEWIQRAVTAESAAEALS